MALYLFRCNNCEHKPALGATSCGSCGRPITIFNWIYTHFVLIIGAALAGYYLLGR